MILHARHRDIPEKCCRKQHTSQNDFSKAVSIFYSTFLFVPVLFTIFAPRKYNIVAMDIEKVVKAQRKKLHISQKDLAEMADVSIATVKQIEAGRGNPSLSTVESIMEVLGMEVRYEVRQTF